MGIVKRTRSLSLLWDQHDNKIAHAGTTKTTQPSRLHYDHQDKIAHTAQGSPRQHNHPGCFGTRMATQTPTRGTAKQQTKKLQAIIYLKKLIEEPIVLCKMYCFSEHLATWHTVRAIYVRPIQYKRQTNKRFKRTLIIGTKTQSANFRSNPLYQATKRH